MQHSIDLGLQLDDVIVISKKFYGILVDDLGHLYLETIANGSNDPIMLNTDQGRITDYAQIMWSSNTVALSFGETNNHLLMSIT